MRHLHRPVDLYRAVPESRLRWIFLAGVVAAAAAIAVLWVGLSHQTAKTRQETRDVARLTDALARQVVANRTALVRLCSTGDVVKHLDGFFLGLPSVQKAPPGETAQQRDLRTRFKNLVADDLTTLARSDAACSVLRHSPQAGSPRPH